ncbi:hypothetical protein ElyMa_005025400 [Elysia marginata]|uniref:Uncharacterized protein n=1 Tax=Elysia marginata TaxID=1093978 RepID=A0AAV4JF28_9GAST|nr:hypothetical protein ElyMa_005025400 [Elysia marginata]
MDADHVFKVPSVKKRRPSLYCKETLDGLDGIWKRTSKTTHTRDTSANIHPICNSKTPAGQNEKEVYSTCNQPEVPSFTNSEHSSNSKYAYAVGLLNELSKTAEHSHGQSEQCEVSDSKGTVRKKFPDDCSSHGEEMSTMIVPDESLVSPEADYVDWDSLTPPAPRSPGDHTVPDLYDLESICAPSESLAYTYDYLASIQRAVPAPEVAGHRVQLHMLSSYRNSLSVPNFSSDHIVPDFYI